MEPDIEIVAPDGTTIKFPAGTPDDEILRVMQENFGGPEDSEYYSEPGMTEDNPIDLATVDRATAAGLTQGTWVKGADGTVYALPSPPTEGQVRVGDEPLAQGVYQRPFSVAEDIAKSIPTGIVEGATGLVGLQGAIGQAMYGEQAAGQYVPGFGFVGPTGEQLNDRLRESLGRDYYQPQSVAGEYARTAGEFLPGLVAPGGTGAKVASWLVPAATSETAGQLARALSGGERDTAAEGFARMGGGLIGGLGVGGFNAARSGADIALRNAAEGVTPQQLEMAAALRQRGGLLGVDLTNAEAMQQATGGATGLGRLQRVVEGQTSRMAPMFANRPAQVERAITSELDRLGPSVEPSTLAPQVRDAAGGVLTRLRQRANEDAGPFYRNLPGQSLPPEQFQQLTENPSFAAALRAVRGDEELAPLLSAELPMDESTRMLRARQQGFNRPAFHETTPEGYQGITTEGFSLAPRRAGAGDFQMPIGVFTKPTGEAIGVGGDNAVQMPLLMRTPQTQTFADRAELASLLRQNPEYGASVNRLDDTNATFGRLGRAADEAWDRTRNTPEGDVVDAMDNDLMRMWKDSEIGAGEAARRIATEDLRGRGLDAITVQNDRGTLGRNVETSVVFDPSNIRSRFDAFPAPTPDNDLNVINEVVKQLGTMADEAAPNSMRQGGSMTRAAQRTQAQQLADALAREASPDYAMARDTVRGVNEAFIDPLKAGPIGALADSSEAAPNLASMTGRLFPDAPFEGQAAETARALELMGEIDPSVGGPLVRQHLARQAMEAQQQLATGDNQFGGANFVARAFGNPEQRRTVMGAIDATAPRVDPSMAFPEINPNVQQALPSDPMANLVEVLQATGQRARAGSETAFNQEFQQQLRGGNLASGSVRAGINLPGIPGQLAKGFDDWTARRNAETLADLLVANSDEFSARLTRAINRPRGANRIRTATAVGAGQED